MPILNIRGPSGSGKTHTMRGVMASLAPAVPQPNAAGKVVGYICAHDTFVMGKYSIVSGGLDASYSKSGGIEQATVDLGQLYLEHKNVLFEGLVASSVLGRWERFAKALPNPQEFIFCFMDTPVEECLRRIYVRNGGKPIKEEYVREKHRVNLRQYSQCLERGLHAVLIPHQDAIATVLGLLGVAK